LFSNVSLANIVTFKGLKCMLCVTKLLKSTLTDSCQELKVGDILISVEGIIVNTFNALEVILDSSIGKSLAILIQRDSEIMTISGKVQDLHAVSPREVISYGDCYVHSVPYVTAIHKDYYIDKGVFLAESGFLFPSSPYVVLSIDDMDDLSLEKIEIWFHNFKHGQQCTIRVINGFRTNVTEFIVIMNRRWYPYVFRLRLLI